MAKSRSVVASVAMVVASACSTSGGASPPRLDHEDGASKPVYQPLMVVPVPELQRTRAPIGRPMEALQARQTPIGDVLLALFKDSDINLVIEPDVQAIDCTFDIKRSTVEEAFEALLHSLDLAYEWDGSFLRIRDTMRDTLTIDLIDPSSGSSSGGGATGGNNASNNANNSGAGGQSFWDDVQQNLPTVLGDDATFVVNRAASTIHVEARPSAVRRLREIIGTTMNRATRQVSIEARVLEVRLENEYSLGVNWSLLPGLFNTGNTGLATGGGIVSQTALSGGTAMTFGLVDTNQFSVFVDALQQQGQVRVLSSPRVSTLNNQPATIAVTDQIPYIVRDVFTTQGVAQTQFSIQFVQAGVQLQVRPLIGEDGLLSVSVTPSVREQIGTAVTPDGLVTVPIISERQATTTVRVADGQAIALGGLRSTRKSESRAGLPFLMDLPWLGQLFSSTVQERDEVELMILLVPRVLDHTWIDEEVQRGAHRLVQLRRGFQWNPIRLDGHRPEDWSNGSLQGVAQSAHEPDARQQERGPHQLPEDNGMTVTRKGLADHLIANAQHRFDHGDVNEAIELFERALELEPTRGDALVMVGVLHARRGHRESARQKLDQALRIDGTDVLALTARGMWEMEFGSPFAARRYFERAHARGNATMTAANLGAAMIACGKPLEARDLLRGFVGEGAPPELFANLAFGELSGGDVPAARTALDEALASGSDARNPRVVALDRLIAAGEAAAAPVK